MQYYSEEDYRRTARIERAAGRTRSATMLENHAELVATNQRRVTDYVELERQFTEAVALGREATDLDITSIKDLSIRLDETIRERDTAVTRAAELVRELAGWRQLNAAPGTELNDTIYTLTQQKDDAERKLQAILDSITDLNGSVEDTMGDEPVTTESPMVGSTTSMPDRPPFNVGDLVTVNVKGRAACASRYAEGEVVTVSSVCAADDPFPYAVTVNNSVGLFLPDEVELVPFTTYRVVGWFSTDGADITIDPTFIMTFVDATSESAAFRQGWDALKAIIGDEKTHILNWFVKAEQ